MPRTAALVFAVAALVAAGAFAYHVLTPAAEPTISPEAGSDDAALREIARRLDTLEAEVFQPRLAPRDPSARLAELEARLQQLEERPETPAADTAVADATKPPRDAPPATADPRSLSDEELVVKARTLGGRQAHDVAAPYWREILARGADDATLVEANLQLGYAHRGAQEHEKEAEYFHEAMRIAGPDSEKGQWANYQIAWSEHFRGDNAAARDRMAEIASSRYTARSTTGHARLYVAQFSLEMNDGQRAREALQSIQRDFGDSERPMDKWLYQRATQMLADLEK